MNKRILEIAKQANVLADFGDDITVGRYSIGGSYEQMEQFAELIVEECIGCARGAGLRDDVALKNGLGFNDGISEVVVNIQKHFGVEE